MDITGLTAAIELGSKAISIFKKAKDLLPDSPDKEAVDKGFAEAEQAFRLAEAKAAKELGYQLCRCTWPPQIMLSIGHEEYGEKFQCPKCRRIWSNELPPL
ncbi:hypothetical protein EDS67_18665 [candidate division KSB1 bacterium]|nr:MAG: hypothetical protein EDS67_18665 [candidate division KSB1 bacterium]MBC6950853.1 hypothetical protein [candidate division KSB1 bacterium]MCE7944528.1 hypothetical protein [Chlorobi bacterium CHB1]MDL1876830.1 hypothetical protein [Cytophagia bacterium CHB2]